MDFLLNIDNIWLFTSKLCMFPSKQKSTVMQIHCHLDYLEYNNMKPSYLQLVGRKNIVFESHAYMKQMASKQLLSRNSMGVPSISPYIVIVAHIRCTSPRCKFNKCLIFFLVIDNQVYQMGILKSTT
jgi:hypothetical protein